MMNRILVIVLIFVFLSFNATALGVTPGRMPIDFQPGSEKDLKFTIINSEHKNLNLMINIQGDLSDLIELETTSVSLSSDEEEKDVIIKVKLPDKLKPGLHLTDIIITESIKDISAGKATLGAALAVTTQLAVYVPYPGKYLESQLSVSGNEKKKNFVIAMIHRGDEKINSVEAEVNIYDINDKLVKKIKTDEISIQPGEKREVSASWDVDLPQGRYLAKAVLSYDRNEVLLEKNFEIGSFVLDLQQIFVKDFKLGGIAKFNLLVQNKWNEPITGAYAEMRIYDKELKEMADLKSATYDIPAGLQTTMNYYWDTSGVSENLYNANVILYYADKKTQQDLKLDVGQDKIDVIGLGYVISSDESGGKGSLTVILIIVIGFLVLLNLVWFFVLRKRRSNR